MIGTCVQFVTGVVLVAIPDPATTVIGAGMLLDACRRFCR